MKKNALLLMSLACLFTSTSCANPTFKSYKQESTAANYATKLYTAISEFSGEEESDYTVDMSNDSMKKTATKNKHNKKTVKETRKSTSETKIKCDIDSEIVETTEKETFKWDTKSYKATTTENTHTIKQPYEDGSVIIDLLENSYTVSSNDFSFYGSMEREFDIDDIVEIFEDMVDDIEDAITYYVDDKVFTMVIDYEKKESEGNESYSIDVDGKLQFVIKDKNLSVNCKLKAKEITEDDDSKVTEENTIKLTAKLAKKKVSLKKKTVSDYIKSSY